MSCTRVKTIIVAWKKNIFSIRFFPSSFLGTTSEFLIIDWELEAKRVNIRAQGGGSGFG
jgi:hypothetical protein